MHSAGVCGYKSREAEEGKKFYTTVNRIVQKGAESLRSPALMDWNFLIQFVLARAASRRGVVGGLLGPRVYIGSPSKSVTLQV